MIWYYAFGFPVVALMFSITSIYIKDNILPSLITSIFWFASSYATTNIDFVQNFTVSADTVYTYAGHPELSYLFIGLGIITATYTILITLKQLQEIQIIK